ncbi:MAG TPA: twin-arginine translocase TatA/TatE family subunit [Bacteroidia bacterium]|nr:twin-arginine translocase TatA/TatE family subunit [Bacteroidia bacterium]
MQSHLLFLNLGGGEIFVIILVVLLFFGSKGVPQVARGLGKGMREFRDAMNGIEREIQQEANQVKDEVKKIEEETKPDLKI